ncbi:MAG TPA: hypothetical protein VG370_04085 [Chloroflexota bacterium]|nr:hypothetical protein [Chloroflexota bacterium]
MDSERKLTTPIDRVGAPQTDRRPAARSAARLGIATSGAQIEFAAAFLSFFLLWALFTAGFRAATPGAAPPTWAALPVPIVALGFAATLSASIKLARGVSIESAELLPMQAAMAIGAIVFVLLAILLEVRAPWFWLVGTLAQPVALVLAARFGERGER